MNQRTESFPTISMLTIQNAALTRACAVLATALRLNTTNGDDWPECPYEAMERARCAISHLSVGSDAHTALVDILSDQSEDAGNYDQGSLLTRFPCLKREPGRAPS